MTLLISASVRAIGIASGYQRLDSLLDCRQRAAVAPHSDVLVGGMGGWGPIVIAGLLCGAALEARAQDSSFHLSSRCAAETTSSAGRVDRVIDGRSFALDDGREIRL